LFHEIPIESMTYHRQKEYYQAINESSNSGNSTPFIEFMLETIYKEIQETAQEKILEIIKAKPEITRKELAELINISDSGVKYHLDKMRNAGIIVHRGSTKKGYREIL
jgi:cell filamentation protein, protein adenylyltransferase